MPAPSRSNAPSTSPTAWREVFASDNARLGPVIAGPEGFIDAGCHTDEDAHCEQGFVVRSADGETWSLSETDFEVDLGAPSLHVVGNRLFALGYGYYGQDGGAVVWTSLDGSSWNQVETSSFRNRAVDDIIESPSGTFAVGYEAPIDSDNTSGFLLWPVRADGSFGKVRDIDTGGEPHLVHGATWIGEEFLAWGLHDGPWAGPTIVLASRDGSAWTKRATIPGPAAGTVSEIVAAGDRLIAVGHEGPGYPLTPRAWVSDDAGRSWTPATVEGDDAAMRTVESEGGRLVARGGESSGATSRAVSWESVDGSTWVLLPKDEDLPAVPRFNALTRATLGGRTCVAGSSYDDVTFRGAIYCR